MENKIKKFINEAKDKVEATNKLLREEHLISIGLIDEDKTERVYIDVYIKDAIYDEESKRYYIDKKVAMDVTTEEYKEICKYYPIEKDEIIIKESNEEGALRTIARIILFIGILASFILLAISISSLNLEVFMLALCILSSSIISWALLKAFANLTMNIREMNNRSRGY